MPYAIDEIEGVVAVNNIIENITLGPHDTVLEVIFAIGRTPGIEAFSGRAAIRVVIEGRTETPPVVSVLGTGVA